MLGPEVRSVRVACVAAFATSLPLIGCAEERPTPSATVRDSAGVRIVEHGAMGMELPTWTLAEAPEAVIGTRADEELSHQFTEIRGAVRLSDGRIVVGDRGTKEARYFDPSGQHLRTVGGGGGGPGEIRFLYAVDRVRDDTMVIGGWPVGARYWFDHRGDFVRNQALGPWFPGMLGRTLHDGSLIIDTYELGSYGNTIENWAASGPDEDFRPEGIVERVARDGSHIDTIGPIRGETHHKTGELRVNFASHALPYGPVGLVAWSADRIFIGHTDAPEIRVHSLEGDLLGIIRWTAEAVPVRAMDRERFETELIENLRRPEQAPDYRRWLLEIDYPDSKPSFAAMIADETGHLWVRPSVAADADSVSWSVFGPDGIRVATVPIPARHRLLDVDATHVLAAWTDELGVEYVSSYEVLR